MKVPYPNEIDWFWLATDVVMPLLAWLTLIMLAAMVLASFIRAMRRREERMSDSIQSTDSEES